MKKSPKATLCCQILAVVEQNFLRNMGRPIKRIEIFNLSKKTKAKNFELLRGIGGEIRKGLCHEFYWIPPDNFKVYFIAGRTSANPSVKCTLPRENGLAKSNVEYYLLMDEKGEELYLKAGRFNAFKIVEIGDIPKFIMNNFCKRVVCKEEER
ncbi:MAG: hypothetical protein US25_C0045G0003 [Candidatus Moranbacteria bacterium GW2011_GWE1_36_7]|nr:MAG: hypothetical protein UR99_C0004G0003 [Candidatus Moranbacteria bacterium GW2011_GWD2_36_12]KKQ06913.1 MAG: hypothetical protein US16_C0006G0003 [Candidatus Moranbacteria bacterium GW2011_GWE2_36_40]KKQ12753.1 MAG: hypothetical protein US25_C0045G0003 [Candidatus Moranbacteria bacterium GW2011_GWE1_36_7]